MQRAHGLIMLSIILIQPTGLCKSLFGEKLMYAVRLRSSLAYPLAPATNPNLTSCCAIAALLQNASVTSADFSFPCANCATRSVAADSVISISFAERRPDSFGYANTLLSLGGVRINHSEGIDSAIRFRLSAASCSQFEPIVDVRTLFAAMIEVWFELQSV